MFLCMFMTWWFMMIYMFMYVCIFIFYKILTVFDRYATKDCCFGTGFYNIIIHYIISRYLSLAFVGDVCGIFRGMCISVLWQISHFHQITHVFAMFASYPSYLYCFCAFLPHISHISAVFCAFLMFWWKNIYLHFEWVWSSNFGFY